WGVGPVQRAAGDGVYLRFYVESDGYYAIAIGWSSTCSASGRPTGRCALELPATMAQVRLESLTYRRLVRQRLGWLLEAVGVDRLAAGLRDQGRQGNNVDGLPHEPNGTVGKRDVGPAGVEAVNVAHDVVAVHHAGPLPEIPLSFRVGAGHGQPVVRVGPDHAG